MANVMYEAKAFNAEGVLVTDSLYETLYRLEEARAGLRATTADQVSDALDWLKARRNSERPGLRFIRTNLDRERTGGYRAASGDYMPIRYLKLPTGEGKWNTTVAALRLILHWEALDSALAQGARTSFLNIYPYPNAAPGRFCCGNCNASYQPALKSANPDAYAAQEVAFIDVLRQERDSRSRWKGHPFYATVLALAEIGTEATLDELHAVAQHVRPSLLNRYRDKADRTSRFRALALKTALAYA